MIEPLRLLVVPDHEVVRRGLRSVLDRQPGWQNARSFSGNRAETMKGNRPQPEVTILDIGALSPVAAASGSRNPEKIAGRGNVLILTTHDSDPLVQAVLDAGARGFLLKSSAGEDIVTAVEAVRRNNALFQNGAGQSHRSESFGDARRSDASAPPATPLTPRQVEVLKLLAEGKCNKEVAVALGLSVKTAETHRANIMRRLECHSIGELVRYAIRNGLIVA